MIRATTGWQGAIPSFDEGRTYTLLRDVCSEKVKETIRRRGDIPNFDEGRTYLFDLRTKQCSEETAGGSS